MTDAGKNKRNYLVHQLYVRQEFESCLRIIDEILAETHDSNEFALYMKAMIKRQKGEIQESLSLFQQATAINPHNVANLKQVGRSLYLLGRHKAAIDVYEEAQRISAPDWEIMHNKGLSLAFLKQYKKAIECFKVAVDIQPHDSTFLQLGKIYTTVGDHDAAIDLYSLALEHSPENTEVLTSLGVLYMRMNSTEDAFAALGSALTHDPGDPRTILAAGSIIQDNGDMDSALIKYRIAAVKTPESPQLWNNVGMCFFGKQRYIAAIACLKRAFYLEPFEWVVTYNLGLVHLYTKQYASSFHYFSSAINLRPDFAHSYMYLGVTLSKLDDVDNACLAFRKAIRLAGGVLEPAFHLNYAVMLFKAGRRDDAVPQLMQFKSIVDAQDDVAGLLDKELLEQAQLLGARLGVTD